ncbi:uncharacterized protein LOC123331130 isoform X1 [Bubalus bubalis]|uniref:uncharacterized protein LOC123331130 isoform X1 n=1 Tax=Bubalus bubalis TaxID=89462 RepID=UPI001E1B912C|nr:uncharacterized protein LOC123331130 isoform X1 [Bubalus bubalis]
MRPGVSHLGGCVTARGPAQGPPLILRLILGASPGVCSELFREEPHSPLLSWDRERCRRSWKIEVIVTEPLLWQEHSCEDSFILVMNKRWEVSCSGIGTSTPDSADDCVDRWQLSASVFLAEQLAAKRGLGSADRGRTRGMSRTAPGQTGLCDADLMGRQEQEFQSKSGPCFVGTHCCDLCILGGPARQDSQVHRVNKPLRHYKAVIQEGG